MVQSEINHLSNLIHRNPSRKINVHNTKIAIRKIFRYTEIPPYKEEAYPSAYPRGAHFPETIE